jgi:nitroreductase/NAD-dependent dihydropyrimidine dehydrogenase PreA subunit
MLKSEKIVIDKKKCLRDGICAEICPCNIFRPDKTGFPQIIEENLEICIGCGHCIASCPSGAITLNQVEPQSLESAENDAVSFDDVKKLVKSRRSVRSFRSEPVSTEELKELLELTRWAPTAKNSQALSWIIVSGKNKVMDIARLVIDTHRDNKRMQEMVNAFDDGYDVVHRGASNLLIAYGPERYKWGVYDASIAMNTIELAAKTRKLGTCWGGFTTFASIENRNIANYLEIPESDRIFAVIMIGKPSVNFLRVPQRKGLNLKIIEE